MPSRWVASLLVVAAIPACMPARANLAVGAMLALPATVLLVDGATSKRRDEGFPDFRSESLTVMGGAIGIASLACLFVGSLQLHDEHRNAERADQLAALAPPPVGAAVAPLPTDERRVLVMRSEARLGHCHIAAAISRQLDRDLVIAALIDDAALRACVPHR